MDIETLIEACFNGLAKGGAGALGSALWGLTQKLIFKVTGKYDSCECISESDALMELNNKSDLAQKIKNSSKDAELEKIAETWQKVGELQFCSTNQIEIQATNSNIVAGLNGTNITISQFK